MLFIFYKIKKIILISAIFLVLFPQNYYTQSVQVSYDNYYNSELSSGFNQNLNSFFEIDSSFEIHFTDTVSSKEIFNSTQSMFLFFKNIPDYNIEPNETKNECTKIMDAFFNEDIEYLDSNRFSNKNYFWLDSNKNSFSNYMKHFPEFKIKFCPEFYDTINNKWAYTYHKSDGMPAENLVYMDPRNKNEQNNINREDQDLFTYSLSDIPIFDTLTACDISYVLNFSNGRNTANPEFLIQSKKENKNVSKNVYKINKDEYDENGDEILSKYEISTNLNILNNENNFVVKDDKENQLFFRLNMDELNSIIYANGQICLSTSYKYKFYSVEKGTNKKYIFTFYKIIGDSFWGNNDEWMYDKKLSENENINSSKLNIRKWNLASISVETQEY